MDRTEITVRNMLQAIKAPLYDIGVLSNRGMLPGLDSIPAEDVLKRLSLLKYRNARGSHIYVRPSGEHRYTVLDDLNETVLMRLAADGFNPCAIIETSAGNFQAWLKHRSVFPKLLGTFTLEAGSRLVQAKIAQTDFTENTERPGDLWLRNKEVCSHIDRHSQNLSDTFISILDLQGLRIESASMTCWAGGVDARQEKQFDAYKAFSQAGLASALGSIERKPSGIITPRFGNDRGTQLRRVGGRTDPPQHVDASQHAWIETSAHDEADPPSSSVEVFVK
jgi:hypothetical protein